MYLNHKILGNYNGFKIQFKFNENLISLIDFSDQRNYEAHLVLIAFNRDCFQGLN